MMILIKFIAIVVVFGLTHVVRSHHVPLYENTNDFKPWDIIMYSQSWPITACREWKDKNALHKCTLPYSWTVHGVWPDFKGANNGPQFCNRSWLFDPEEIKSIETELTEHWTNIEIGTPHYQFWAHEWNKHGTCAASIEPLNSQFKYFSQGLNWNKQFNITNILEDSGIVPSNEKEYSTVTILNTLKNKLGATPLVICYMKSGRSYLVEVRMCLNKSLEVIDCGSRKTLNKKFTTNCSGSEVIYPKTVEALEIKKYHVPNALNMNMWPKLEVVRI